MKFDRVCNWSVRNRGAITTTCCLKSQGVGTLPCARPRKERKALLGEVRGINLMYECLTKQYTSKCLLVYIFVLWVGFNLSATYVLGLANLQ